MMHHYNVTGEDRKRLVKVASEFLGIKAEYQYMPSCSYKIGTYEISKDGILSWSDMDDMDPEHMAKSQDLVSALEAAGFHSDEFDFVAEQLHDDGFHAEEANLPEPAFTRTKESVRFTFNGWDGKSYNGESRNAKVYRTSIPGYEEVRFIKVGKALCYIDEGSTILEKATGEAHPEAGWIMDVERA